MANLVQPSILPGFMELLPEEQVEFNRVKRIIEKNFINYGFFPLDTPLIEKEEILLSKGGGETSKQIFRIEKAGESSTPQALRFDFTVSLARYCAQHSHEIHFPFRRYQIGKVYRGERSQRGRYREFYQCDIDIVGREKLAIENDAEVPALMYAIFSDLGLEGVRFHINNRKLLNGYFEFLEISCREDVLRTLDKLAKIGRDKVEKELEELGLTESQISQIFDLFKEGETNEEILDRLEGMEVENEVFQTGLSELRRVYETMQAFSVPEENIVIDLSITRGLDYYTGSVFETFLKGYESIGSICSGGRYDDLASNFTKEKLPGIGMSIGLTRLFYQLKEADLLHLEAEPYLKCLILPMGKEDLSYGIELVDVLREAGITAQIYLESGKLKKKFSYADKLGVPYVLIIGESERTEGKVSVKDMRTGEQKAISKDDLIQDLK